MGHKDTTEDGIFPEEEFQSPPPLNNPPLDVTSNGGTLTSTVWNLWEHEGQVDPLTLQGKLHLREVINSSNKLESVLNFYTVDFPRLTVLSSYCFIKQDMNLCTLTGHPLKLNGSVLILSIPYTLGTGFQVHTFWKHLLRDVVNPPVSWGTFMNCIEGITVLRAGQNSGHKIFIWVNGSKVDRGHFPQLTINYLGELSTKCGLPSLKNTLESHSYNSDNSDMSQIQL